MSHLHQEINDHPETAGISGLMQAVIWNGAATMSDTVTVLLGQFASGGLTSTTPAAGTIMLGPCRWQARDATSKPARGMLCLIAIDDYGAPWVIAWWPF